MTSHSLKSMDDSPSTSVVVPKTEGVGSSGEANRALRWVLCREMGPLERFGLAAAGESSDWGELVPEKS